MSGIDLWGDDDLADAVVVEAPPLRVGMITTDEQLALWQSELPAFGIQMCAPEDELCQIIVVDERLQTYPEKLALLALNTRQPHVPVFFLVKVGDESECLRIFAAGADSYVHLPISAEALAAKLKRVETHFCEIWSTRQQLAESSKIAFQSMSLNAEFGRILQYMEYSFACKDYPSLAQLTLDVFAEFGLHISLGFFHDRGVEFFFDDGQPRPMEQEVLERSRKLQRITDFGSRTILNYTHVAILIRNMPTSDPLRYGIIKDHICYIANGLEARIQAMITELLAQERSTRIQSTAFVLQQMMREMEQARLDVTRQSAEELQAMLENLNIEFSQLCLTAPEEERLMTLLNTAGDRINALFKRASESDQLFQSLLAEVAKTLER
jgi:CheY-like chemotaxis protein